MLSEEKKLTVQEGTSPPKCLPARVREIVTKNLSESCESLPRFLRLSSLSSSTKLILSLLSLPPSLGFPAAGGTMSSVMSLQDENRVLQGELARLEDLLAHSRADRDELAIKYGAISERVSVTGNRLSTVNVVDVNQRPLMPCSHLSPPICFFTPVFVWNVVVSQVMGAGMK